MANLYGTPAKLKEIRTICDENHAVLIEDAAESLGAVYHKQQTGTFGTYNAISFNGNKIVTCSGGGMLLTNEDTAAEQVRKWSTQSREAAPWYQHKETGYNYRMSNIVAGIGRGQMLHLEEHVKRKREIYFRYKEGFAGLPITMNPYIEEEMQPNFWLSCMLIEKSAMCKQVRSDTEALYVNESGKSCPTQILETLAKYNAEGRPIWKPMHLQPTYHGNIFVTEKTEKKMAGSRENDCISNLDSDVGADLFARGLCLPSDIKMTREQQDKIIQIVWGCFEG